MKPFVKPFVSVMEEASMLEVAAMQVQMKRAGEDREKQNKEFQQIVADQ